MALCLIFVAGFRNGESMPDYASYAGYYSYVIEGQFSYFIEISFTLIVKLANSIIANNSTLMFLVYAFFGVSLKFYAIKINTSHFLFISYLCKQLFYYSRNDTN